nr:ankyrin repeat domain-containing protein [uncultured Acetatifactor sp.]
MDDQIQKDFLRKRMIELREKNHKTQSDMAELIGCNKSTLSRAEKIGGDTSYKTVLGFAHDYCDKLGLTSRQKDQFLRGDRVVVTDTSALLKNSQLIDELSREYSRVIVPDIVVEELDSIKDHNPKLAKKAWQILKSIGSGSNVTTGNPAGERKAGSYDGQAVKVAQGAGRNPPGKGRTGNPDGQDVKAAEGAGRNPPGKGRTGNPDAQIVKVAEKAAEEFHCQVDIITYDAGFAARLSGHATVKALYLEEYMVTKQNLMDIQSLKKINAYYADSYEDMESALGVTIPNREDINAYLPEGNTLIISVVRCRKKPMNQRKEKIRWLIGHGADVDRRDCGKYYFPPLSHAVQNRDFEMFRFLLHECRANPNVGSRNPYDAGKIRQKNDGNMPLMIAAWDNRVEFVRELCENPRISLNQQDGNGYTALMKACHWGWLECRDIIRAAGADERIVDRNGYTAEDHYREYLETGRSKNRTWQKNQNEGRRRGRP